MMASCEMNVASNGILQHNNVSLCDGIELPCPASKHQRNRIKCPVSGRHAFQHTFSQTQIMEGFRIACAIRLPLPYLYMGDTLKTATKELSCGRKLR